MKPTAKMNLSQNMTLTPQLLQSIRLLQLSSLELEQEVQEALEANPLLERDDEGGTGSVEMEAAAAEIVSVAPADIVSDAASLEEAVTGIDAAAGEKVEVDFDWSSAESWSGGEPTEEGEPIEARRAAPAVDDARIAALSQLELLVDDARTWQLVVAIVENIDDNGYLEKPLPEIRSQLPQEWSVSLSEIEAALTTVQSVEPTGFAARDLRECLLLQLETVRVGTPGRNLAERLVGDYLDRVAAHDFARLQRELQVDDLAMRRALDLIKSLDPKPGASRVEPAQAVVPDLIITGTEGDWKIELNPANLPRLRINSHYERALTASAHKSMRDQLQQARWLVRGLEMRHETLLKTARVVFARQRNFLKRGEEGMMPLTLREVADAISMHESTVCRVTSNKYVETPWGIYAMKTFFPSQIQGAESETSGIAVKAMIRKIVDGEKATAPLCDGAIAAILARNGVLIARRTIAKYREAMKIAPAKLRHQPQAGYPVMIAS